MNMHECMYVYGIHRVQVRGIVLQKPTCMHECMSVCMNMYDCMFMGFTWYVVLREPVCAYAYIYIYIYIYIYMYVCMYVCM